MKTQKKAISNRVLCALFCLAILSVSHNAFAQSRFYPAPMPQVDYEMTKGEVQLLEADYEPMYPARASSRSITGWIEIGFDVDANGQVIVGSTQIISAEPNSIFDSATIRSVEKFRFIPYAPEGTAQVATGVQYRFRYSIL